MGIEKQAKINQLLTSTPSGVVLQSNWLNEKGYSPALQQRYRNSNWLVSIGKGAMIRTGDKVGYEGAIYSLQKHSGLTIHPAGRTALTLLGKAHYLELSSKKAIVFGGQGEMLPSWFQNHDWGVNVEYHPTSFLPSELGLVEVELKSFTIKVSSAVRAVMECLYLAPEKQELMECYELMEGLNNLRPNKVQELLEKCESVKVKRLFIYMAEKVGHDWFKYLDMKHVDLGKGKRSIVKNGVYVPKYLITVPKELEEYGKRSI